MSLNKTLSLPLFRQRDILRTSYCLCPQAWYYLLSFVLELLYCWTTCSLNFKTYRSFVLKEFIRCFYIAGKFKVVDSMYVHWNFIFAADKVILYNVFILFSWSIWRYILSAMQIIPKLGSFCECGLRHMWLYVLMGCHCYAFCFETRQAVCGSTQGSLAFMGTD